MGLVVKGINRFLIRFGYVWLKAGKNSVQDP